MAQRWVVNSSGGSRMIGGKLLAPGEGTFVDDGPLLSALAPVTLGFVSATEEALASSAALGAPVPTGTLLIDPATRLIYGQSDGIGGVKPLGGVTQLSTGELGFVDDLGREYPLTMLAGTGHEPTIAGGFNQMLTLNAGADADHAEALLTFQATSGGDPDVADPALASSRFTAPNGNAEVIKSAITGPTAGEIRAYSSRSGPITLLHVALRGAGPYTDAAGNVVTALQMVLMKWPAALNVTLVEVRFGTSTDNNGLQVGLKRLRQITVLGYSI